MDADSGGGSDRPGSTKFIAKVTYIRPDFTELRRRFPGNVDQLFRNPDFAENTRRRGVSREAREVAFEYVHMSSNRTGQMFSEKLVSEEMDRRRLWPAIYEEILAFAEKFPDEQYRFPIVALGSVMTLGVTKVVPYLWCNTFDRTLEMHWPGGGSRQYVRFLAVPKAR